MNALSEHERTSYLRDVEGIIRDRFPGGDMQVPYETRLWIATNSISPADRSSLPHLAQPRSSRESPSRGVTAQEPHPLIEMGDVIRD